MHRRGRAFTLPGEFSRKSSVPHVETKCSVFGIDWPVGVAMTLDQGP